MKKEFYNPEKETRELYTEKWVWEKTTVKDIKDLNIKHHYWIDSDGEWWVDFDNPMENVHADFKAYRDRKNYMQPNELKKLRTDMHLSIREFADYMGLGYSNLSQIENNQRIQTKYQDVLFKLVQEKFNALGYAF